ncbi:hypothetical protein OS493_007707 [Desmophyllum pertusum]|uniref:Uncharacterized protein n=1 Tax=Desmophyllum pertusum TaxID=174260 RepID=A0A9W9YRU7_9CNID|nr:hypothetical protein OS493_007707 [Desmophyllum pertusum]
MCGSLLSKFRGSSNKIDPALNLFPEPPRAPSEMKFSNEDSACFQDREFWNDGVQNGESSAHSLPTFQSKSSLKDECLSESDSSSQDEMEAALRALACTTPRDIFPSQNKNNKNYRLCVIDRDQRLLDSAREILAFQTYGASSSSSTARAVQPLSSTNQSTLPGKMQTAVAFDIPTGENKTVCPSVRVPWRLRKRKVAPERTLEDVKEKMRAAEERKVKELERIRECARSRAGASRPHPAETSAQATAVKIAAKQAAADSKRNEETEKRREASNRASRNRSRIAAAQAFAKTRLQSSINRKVEKTEQKKVKHQQKIDRQNKQREKHAKKVKDKVTRMRKEEEDEIRADLEELETYQASDDSDESWGDEHEEKVVYEWEDFFAD